MKKLLCVIFLISFVLVTNAKDSEFNVEEFISDIEPTEISPQIDGIINKNEWEKAYTFKNFWD